MSTQLWGGNAAGSESVKGGESSVTRKPPQSCSEISRLIQQQWQVLTSTGNLKPPHTVVGMQMVQSLWKTSWQFLKEWPCDPPILIIVHTQEKYKVPTETGVQMSTAALFTTVTRQQLPACVGRWMDTRTRYVHGMDRHSAAGRKEGPACATTWINLDNILIHGRCQTQNITHMIPFT